MTIPKHIAIIMDGNRRWARQKGLEAVVGHQQMVEEGISRVVTAAKTLGVKYLTLWAMSTENWHRDAKEVAFLLKLFRKMFTAEAEKLHKENVRILAIGDLSRFDQDIQESAKKWIDETKKNTGITVIFAINYGGRDELLRAVEKITKEVKDGKLGVGKLTEQEFAQSLDTAGIPDPELIIRPGGEQRLSGFLLWQNNYSELYFTDVLMPDFDGKELAKAVKEFSKRTRRFGK